MNTSFPADHGPADHAESRVMPGRPRLGRGSERKNIKKLTVEDKDGEERRKAASSSMRRHKRRMMREDEGVCGRESEGQKKFTVGRDGNGSNDQGRGKTERREEQLH